MPFFFVEDIPFHSFLTLPLIVYVYLFAIYSVEGDNTAKNSYFKDIKGLFSLPGISLSIPITVDCWCLSVSPLQHRWTSHCEEFTVQGHWGSVLLTGRHTSPRPTPVAMGICQSTRTHVFSTQPDDGPKMWEPSLRAQSVSLHQRLSADGTILWDYSK